MGQCPKCGSSNVRFEIRSAGTKTTTNYYRTGVHSSWFIPAGQKRSRSERRQKSVGICNNCGHVWSPSENNLLYYIVCIIFLPITLSVLFYKSKRISLAKGWRLLIIAAAFAIFLGGVSIWDHNQQNQPAAEIVDAVDSIWATEYTPLSDFEYYVENSEIHLKKYQGSSKKVNIAPTYEYDGVEMAVVELDSTFAVRNADSVIVPEGVCKISSNCFNSCGVEYLYLPSTLTEFSGWNYFHDVEKLYFGGTAEAFNEICNRERSQLEIVQIITDAQIDQLIG